MDPHFVGDANGPGPDLALVEVDDPAFAEDLPPMGLAAIDRDSPTAEPVERCHAIGYPWFAETPSPTAKRETVDAIGVLPVASGLAGGLLSVVVSVAPRPLPPEDRRLTDSEWAGMSGAPVVAAGKLVGVVIEHAPRAGPSTITAVPLTALQHDDQHPSGGRGWPTRRPGGRGWAARPRRRGHGCQCRQPQGGRRRTVVTRCAGLARPCTGGCPSCSAVRGTGRDRRVRHRAGQLSVAGRRERMRARAPCCMRRSPWGCRTRWTWSATSCLGGPRMPAVDGSSRR